MFDTKLDSLPYAFASSLKYLILNFRAILTRMIRTGTSSRRPMTVAKAWLEVMPKTAAATAMASSKSPVPAVANGNRSSPCLANFHDAEI